MKRKHFLWIYVVLLLAVGAVSSCGQESEDQISQLVERLVNDSNFANFAKVEDERMKNIRNKTHDLQNVDWKLIDSEKDKVGANGTKELFTRAGMKNAEVYLDLLNQYISYRKILQENYPELSSLSSTKRVEIFNAAKARLPKQQNRN